KGFNRQYFATPNTTNSYWAGFIAADGCVGGRGNSISIVLSKQDQEHLEKFKVSAQLPQPITNFSKKSPRSESNYEYSSLVVVCEEWARDLLTNFNITSKKSLTLEPPPLKEDEN